MPKDYFSTDNQVSLETLEKGAKIHFIGVAGVAMGNLAIALSEEYSVSGSDKEFYEPMGSALKNSSIKLLKGYKEENLDEKPDLVVIGNAISYGHPEVTRVENEDLPYTCFSSILYDFLIRGKKSIVACGTHGKTTTTALTSFIPEKLGLKPSFFIGGKIDSLEKSLTKQDGDISVVEGDEYDDVFYSKQSKFMHYKPDICIINAMEFDHADIFSDFNAVKETFHNLCLTLNESQTLIYSKDSAELCSAISEWKDDLKCNIISFGESEGADFQITNRESDVEKQTVSILDKNSKEKYVFDLQIPGIYNARNALASLIALNISGTPISESIKVISGFKGVKRRQEVRYDSNGLKIIEDFAHHPTAIKLAVDSIREIYPTKKLIAVFEPRSNTSRLKVFYEDYLKAFLSADLVVLKNPEVKQGISEDMLLNVKELSNEMTNKGIQTTSFDSVDGIKDFILENVTQDCVVIIMSNGSFGGLITNLLEKLS